MRKTSVWVLCGLMGLATAAVAAAQTGSTGAMGTESGTGSMGSSSGSMGSSSGDMSKRTTSTKKSTKKHTTAKAKVHSVTGEVTAIDATAKTMTVHPKKGADVNLSWNDKTVVTPKGQDPKQGDIVTASYKTSGGTKMATRIRIHAPKAAAPAAAAPAPATTPK